MIYPEFENIKIDHEIGVSPVGEDTKMMARYLSRLKFKKAVEIGTGTGFIPIYLSKIGKNCIGTDINPLAIKSANKNALNNDLKVKFLVSNLFENVEGVFDLITFNPPYGNIRSVFFTRVLETIKSLLPKDSKLSKLAFKFTKKTRERLIKDFLKESENFIGKHGRIVIVMHSSQINILNKYTYKICGIYKDMRIVDILL